MQGWDNRTARFYLLIGKKKLLLTCKDGKSGDETRRDWLHECLAQNLNSWLSRKVSVEGIYPKGRPKEGRLLNERPLKEQEQHSFHQRKSLNRL